VETDLTIPIVPPEKAADLAIEAAGKGFRIFKIKVGRELAADLARVTAVKNAVPACRMRVDANQGFSAKAAVHFAEAIKAEGIEAEVFEQPVHRNDIEGMHFVRNHVSIPVYADESVFWPEEAARIAQEQAADGINIKAMKSGVFETLDIISIAKANGLGIMIGCMGESSIGNCFSLQLACGFKSIVHVDLDSPFFYEKDFLKPQNAKLEPTGKAGIGIEYDEIAGSELISHETY
jgi:L-alanine-DL-glutamate epimerase-like enolase superfamily enzyme